MVGVSDKIISKILYANLDVTESSTRWVSRMFTPPQKTTAHKVFTCPFGLLQ